MSRQAIALVLAAVALLAGCGGDDEGGGGDPSDAARAVVERFGAAAAARDYRTMCADLLADRLVQAVERVGLPCEVALQRALGEVRSPRIEVREVAVRGDRALASVHSTAAGQEPSDDAIELVREDGGWRITSLAGSGGPTGTATATTPTTTTPTTTTPTTTSPTTPTLPGSEAEGE